MEFIVISVNIYKSFETLEHQLENIKKHVQKNYIVILNCNNYMFDILQDKKLEDNIHINPEIIEKSRFHGSLTRGIVSNMKYALENFKFSYFIILSGRTIFYRDLDIEKFKNYFSKKIWSSVEDMDINRQGFLDYREWHWSSLIHTKLAQYYIYRNYKLASCGAHEGVCFSYNVAKNIIIFVENNPEIADDLYNFNHCVEEFSIHTISENEYDINNMEHGFVYIGNGPNNDWDQNNLDLYTRKIDFLT
jgi:hypothetical protein